MGTVLNFYVVVLVSATGLFMLLKATRRGISAVCFTAILFGLAALTISAISPDDDLLQGEFCRARFRLGISNGSLRSTCPKGISLRRPVVAGLARRRHVPQVNTRVELLFATAQIFPLTYKRDVSACRAPPLISSPA